MTNLTPEEWRQHVHNNLTNIQRWFQKRLTHVPHATYYTLCGLTLWPLAEQVAAAAINGASIPISTYNAFLGITAGIGGNLLATLFQEWKDKQTQLGAPLTQETLIRWLAEHAIDNDNHVLSLDQALKNHVKAIEEVTPYFSSTELRNQFLETLEADLRQLSKQNTFTANLEGDQNIIIQSEGNVNQYNRPISVGDVDGNHNTITFIIEESQAKAGFGNLSDNRESKTAFTTKHPPYVYLNYLGSEKLAKDQLGLVVKIVKKSGFKPLFPLYSLGSNSWIHSAIYGMGYCRHAILLVDHEAIHNPSAEMIMAWWMMHILKPSIFQFCIICLDVESQNHFEKGNWMDFEFPTNTNISILLWDRDHDKLTSWLEDHLDKRLKTETKFEQIERHLSEDFGYLQDEEDATSILYTIDFDYLDGPHHRRKTVYAQLTRLLLYKGLNAFYNFITKAGFKKPNPNQYIILNQLLNALSVTWLPIEAAAKIPPKLESNNSNLAILINCKRPETAKWYLDLAYLEPQNLFKSHDEADDRFIEISTPTTEGARREVIDGLSLIFLKRKEPHSEKLIEILKKKSRLRAKYDNPIFIIHRSHEVPDRQFLTSIHDLFPDLPILVLTESTIESDDVPYVDIITPRLDLATEEDTFDIYEECREQIEVRFDSH